MTTTLRALAANAFRSLSFRGTAAERLAVLRTLLAIQRSDAARGASGEVAVKILGRPMRGFRGGTLRYLFDEVFLQKQYAFKPAGAGPVIIDCGANIGFAVLFFKLKYPDARIVAFEANPQAFRMLQHNVTANRFDDVDLRQVAVSDHDGQIPFFLNADPGSLLSSTRQDRGGAQQTLVPCERLSGTLRDLDRVDLVKIDVEGAEWAVLDDLKESGLLAKPANYIIEYHHQIVGEPARFSQFLAPFEEAGYRYQVAARIKNPSAFQDVLIHLTRIA